MSPKGDIRGLPGGRLSALPAMKGLKTTNSKSYLKLLNSNKNKA